MKKPLPIPEHWWKIMKITFSQIILAVIFSGIALAHDTQAQEVLNRTISVVGERLELKDILSQIEKQADVKFVYSTKINSNQRLTLKVNNRKLSLVLDEILKPIAVDYEVIESRILLKKSKPEQGLLPNEERIEPLINEKIEKADITVKGRVTDENGAPLPGVSVVVRGTQRGITTNPEGRFSIDVPDNSAVLVFSFVGYIPQEIVVGNQTQINLGMKIDTKSLGEVIVVGYGTQKKANLTGAVDMVTGDVFDNRPMTNLNQGLQGVLPNLNIKMGDGKPNQAPSFNIRGTTSIGQGGNALVLIDNVEGDPSLLNPNDIASGIGIKFLIVLYFLIFELYRSL